MSPLGCVSGIGTKVLKETDALSVTCASLFFLKNAMHTFLQVTNAY